MAPGLSDRLLRVRKVIGSPSCCFGDTADTADVDWVRVVMDDSESIDIREQSDDEDTFGSLCCEVPLLLLLGDALLLQLMVVMVESDLGLDDATRVMLM
jgi:hypothetical protein